MTDATPPLTLEGTHLVPKGKLTAAVTWLGMTSPPAATPVTDALALRRLDKPDLAAYRALFRRIGEDWLWTSRLRLTDAALTAIIEDARVEIFVIERDGADIGMVELDLRIPGEVEIVYFGLISEVTGKGLGRIAMQRTLERAFRPGIAKVWLHTCTHDHPAAVGFYQRAGFEPYAYGIDIFDDPRLTGLIPATAAPHIPLIR